VADCNTHAALTHHYTVRAAAQRARDDCPPTFKEYTNCPDVIQRALLAQIGRR